MEEINPFMIDDDATPSFESDLAKWYLIKKGEHYAGWLWESKKDPSDRKYLITDKKTSSVVYESYKLEGMLWTVTMYDIAKENKGDKMELKSKETGRIGNQGEHRAIAKVLVGSRLHETATPESDWDYRGIFVDDLKETLSPFRNHKTTSWIEGDEDNTSYELREFCKLATKGNAAILEVFFSNKIIETSPIHQEMQGNWEKFMDTHHFINASRGYAHNQYKKALSYDDLGERQQIRTAKFVIAFLRVLWQCEQYLLHDEFKCSLKTCDMYEFIKDIKGKSREELDIPLCFAKMEEMDKRLLKAEQWCKENTPEVYDRKPDIEYIEGFLLRAYKED